MPKLRVLLADDHVAVREGLKAIINGQRDMTVIAEATSGTEAVQQAMSLRPDLVLMDLSMPHLNGLKATENLRESCPEVKVLALTRHAQDGYVQRVMQAGASGYVLKQSRTSELLNAIRAVASGGTYLDSGISGALLGNRGRHKPDPSKVGDLRPREEQVLRLVAWGHSNKEIADQLSLSVKTVESHKANAMQKLGLHHRIDVVRFALLTGWLDDT